MDEHLTPPVVESTAVPLAEAIEQALPGWVERSVARLAIAFHGRVDDDVRAAATEAGRRAAAEVGGEGRELLAVDIDDQRTEHLSLLRGAVRDSTEELQVAGLYAV